MKNRPWKYLALFLLLVFGFGFYFLSKEKPNNQSNLVQEVASQKRIQPQPSLAKTNATVEVPNKSVGQPTNEVLQKRHRQLEQIVEEKNVPMAFYGKVVDQDGNPLSGVKIRLSVRHWHVVSFLREDAEFSYVDRETDAEGNFELSGAKGDSIDIKTMEEEGYELSPKVRRGYGYNGPEFFNPDSNNPVTFRMWKKGDSETLVVYDKDTRIPYDGTPVIFDLLKGEKSFEPNASGDIRIMLRREPQMIQARQRFDWFATIEVLNGGLIESNDEFMYRAPEIGYAQKFNIQMHASQLDWTHRKKISFYIKTRRDFYGRLLVEFRTDSTQTTTGITITSAINPSGSRNLESY